jgi:hypothetical protein
MNWKTRPFAGVALTVLGLSSCNLMHKSDGTLIRNPTVADMEKFEAEMGIQPKPVMVTPPATTINPSAGAYVPDSAPRAAPTVIAPATVPAETLQPLTPAPATPPTIPPLLR